MVDLGTGFGRSSNDDNFESYANIHLDKDIGNGKLTMINPLDYRDVDCNLICSMKASILDLSVLCPLTFIYIAADGHSTSIL